MAEHYFLFAWHIGYSEAGSGDFVGKYDSIEAAKEGYMKWKNEHRWCAKHDTAGEICNSDMEHLMCGEYDQSTNRTLWG